MTSVLRFAPIRAFYHWGYHVISDRGNLLFGWQFYYINGLYREKHIKYASLIDIPSVFEKADIIDQHPLIREVFKPSLTFIEHPILIQRSLITY